MPFDDGFENERHQRKECEQRRDREGGDEIIFIVEDLDMQRHRVGLSAQMAGNDRHRAELPHRARIAEQYAIEQPPADIGQGDAPKGLEARGAERQRRLLVLRSEEHTSELQSLMRISYAVFCLKQKHKYYNESHH